MPWEPLEPGPVGEYEPFVLFSTLPALFQQMIDLAFDRLYLDFRIHQSSWPDDLLHNFTARLR